MSENRFRAPFDRRRFLKTAAGTAVVAGIGLPALSTVAVSPAFAASTAPITPRYGAGVFNVDPDQRGVSQSSAVVITGDIRSLPLNMAL